MATLRQLDDDAIVNKLHELVQSEREVTAELLRYLAEVDRRQLYAARGYPSLFAYCQDVLCMAEPSIYVRIQAARCCQRFPRLIELLRHGELHLSAVTLLAPRLSETNFDQLIEAARHKSKRQVKCLVEDLDPKPAVPSSVRKLPERQPALKAHSGGESPPVTPERIPVAEASASSPAATSSPNSPVNPRAATQTVPLGLKRYQVRFTASEQLQGKIEQAQDLMRHRNPSGDLAVLFEAALDQLLRSEHKRRHGATDRPRAKPESPPPATQASRHIPNHIKREIFERDGGQCTFVSADGHRCSERGWLQYHHREAYAKGGPASADNVVLLCRAHNDLEARREYGEANIAAKIAQARNQRKIGAAPPLPAAGQRESVAGATRAGSSPALRAVDASHCRAPGWGAAQMVLALRPDDQPRSESVACT